MSQLHTEVNTIKYQKNKNDKKTFLFFKKSNSNLLTENTEILIILEMLKEDLNYVNNCLDYVTDPLLIDSYIYQLQSINMKYQFYIQLCKQRGLIADIL